MRHSPLSRRAIGAMLASGLAAPALAQGPQPLRLMLDWLPNGDYGAYYLGIERGFWRDAGIALTIERGFGSSDTVTKIAAGTAPFGLADIAALMAGRLRGQVPVKAVAPIYTRPPHAIFTLDGPIRSFKDLEGRSLAGAPGSSVRVMLPLVLRRNNVDIARINMINSEPATMVPLLMTGRADAVTSFITNTPRFEQQARAINRGIRPLPFHDTLEIYGNCLIASEATLAQSPDLVRRFTIAMMRALGAARENPRAAIEAMMRVVPGLNAEIDTGQQEIVNSLTFDSAVARANPTGSWDAPQLRRTWEAVAEAQGFDLAQADAESFVARGFTAGA
ncbi:MAG: ABC transporter substrate-binding protein [Alphaproteobacteria bacterium]|nr:ABC transporter substrate-binding protein [Alphaproteobacteria bacterium]